MRGRGYHHPSPLAFTIGCWKHPLAQEPSEGAASVIWRKTLKAGKTLSRPKRREWPALAKGGEGILANINDGSPIGSKYDISGAIAASVRHQTQAYALVKDVNLIRESVELILDDLLHGRYEGAQDLVLSLLDALNDMPLISPPPAMPAMAPGAPGLGSIIPRGYFESIPTRYGPIGDSYTTGGHTSITGPYFPPMKVDYSG
jgi:hypothetical protein